MKQNGKRKITFPMMGAVMAFLIVMSFLWTPQEVIEYDTDTFQPVMALQQEDIDAINSCEIDENGDVEITGVDAYFLFAGIEKPNQLIKVNFGSPLKEDTSVRLYVNWGDGLSEGKAFTVEAEAGAESVHFFLADSSYIDLRLDIDADYQFKNIEIGTVDTIRKNATTNPYWLAWALGVAIVVAIGLVLLDKRKDVSTKLVEFFARNKNEIIRTIKWLILDAVVSVIAAVVIGKWILHVELLSLYGLYAMVILTALIFLVLCAVMCIVYYRKTLVEDFDKVFLIMTLVVGFTMIVATPISHASWDTETHYKWTVETSYLGDTKLTQSDLMVIKNGTEALLTRDVNTYLYNIKQLTVRNQEVVSQYEGTISAAHIPSAIFIAIGRMIGMPFVIRFMFGKIPNLLLYVTACYLGMKQLKHGKLILAIIALFPTNLFLATNYSYDYWITCLSIFAMAYFVGILQDKKRMADGKDAFIMSACFALACIPKQIYFPLLLIPFLMPPKKIQDKKKYYLICVLLLAALVASFVMRSLGSTSGGGDTRGGAVNPGEQLAFVFGDIFGYAVLLLKFLFTEYLTIANMQNYISNYAYLGVAGGSIVFIILLVVVSLFDKDEAYTKETKSNWLNRIYVILMYFGGSALIASALYVSFTPVGHPTVLGCQARYIVPWLYPICSVWAMNGMKPLLSKKVLTWAVVLGCYGILFYNLATVYLPSVVCLG